MTLDTLLRHEPAGLGAAALDDSLHRHLTYDLAKTPETATDRDWFTALALTVRDRLVDRLMATMHRYYQQDVKRVYYLSMEFLIGRSLRHHLLALGIEEKVRELLAGLGMELETLIQLEDEAALGNGGLGRLAACLLDSLATLNLPGYGYGIRYEYGLFSQRIDNGWQIERPDNWLRYGNPWEMPRSEVIYPVWFYGRVEESRDADGRLLARWVEAEQVMAMAYDLAVPGFGAETVNNLRLWSAKSSREFELSDFNRGNYIQAVEHKTASENLSRVLYPDDSTHLGRELRLKQEYFFVSASIQDLLRRYLATHADFDRVPDKIVIQLNDTHPALAIVEWMRLLLDVHRLEWRRAWDLTRRIFAYTNHTLLPEALETWPVALIERVLPRHLQLLYEINRRHLQEVARRFPGDIDRLRRLSLIDEEGERRVRMAHLAVVGSARVNGVSALHTELLRTRLFADFHALNPDQLIPITNGITPRRWLNQANGELAHCLDEHIGRDWRRDLEHLRALEPLAGEAAFGAAFEAVKQRRKERLCQVIAWRTGLALCPEVLFDVQIKRIHEYKRQLLKLLHVIVLYNRLRRGEAPQSVPRLVLFAGKAAPGYEFAKLLIKLIHDVADWVNRDALTNDRLRLVFVPNYDVSTASEIIPAADLSEQISTAGFEASGTGNMKLALNGALTIGTLDGANIEIREAVGPENFFLCGRSAEEVSARRYSGHDPRREARAHPALYEALEQIAGGLFAGGARDLHKSIVDRLLHQDHYLVLADFADYLRSQDAVEALYRDRAAWRRKALLNVARMGWFSSDRTVREYSAKIWGLDA